MQIISLRELFSRRETADRAERLLQELYPIYVECFPDENERVAIDVLRDSLQPDDYLSDILLALVDDRVIGARHYQVLDDTTVILQGGRVAAGEYIYVTPDARGGGYGTQLYEAANQRLKNSGISFIVTEVNDPHLMTQEAHDMDREAGLSSEERVAFWKRRGVRALDVLYIQPALAEGLEPVEHLMMGIRATDLASAPLTEMPRDVYVAICRAYHGSWLEDVEANRSFQQLCQATEQSAVIPVIDLDAERRCVRERTI